MQLETIKVQGFKSIRELEFSLRPLNILIGANGCGKSNILGVFAFLRAIVERHLQMYVARAGGVDRILHFGQKNTDSLQIELWFTKNDPRFRGNIIANGYRCALVPAIGDRFVFADERAFFHDRRYDKPVEKLLGSGHEESLLPANYGRGIPAHVFEAMQSWIVYHFHDTGDSARVKQTGDIDDNYRLRQDASNLAAYLYYIQQQAPDQYRNIVDVIRMVAPFFDDFVLRPSPFNPNKIKLEWRERGSDTYFDAYALSDGTLRFICLATLLLQPTRKLPAIILLDEPEMGLPPYAIHVLAGLLRSVATQTQVIVATQSVTLVNQFEPEDIVVVERQDGQSVCRRLTTEEVELWLDDYGLGDLWEKNILGGRPIR
ncbi:AAA family ATPase [Chloroflexus sp.]|uniref:AAA family ATPase n=1 Tax=Chloroflexus sp. TaxID=1904827 RepID=UPI002ADE08E3|nr:AAA family ATPase [Chloroflexus sp.]